MKAEKTVLIQKMPGLYAVGMVTLGGEFYYAAASEMPEGPVALVHCETNEVHEIHGGLGGVMGIMSSVKENCLLSIEEFYPGFDAPHSKIIEIQLEKKEGKWEAVSRRQVAEVPYLHRLSLLSEADGHYLAAGKLCLRKDHVDDWSTGGTLEMLAYDGEEVLDRETIREGLFKHHAMLTESGREGDLLYFGGTEGVFSAIRRDGAWEVKQLLDAPASEIVYVDLDGDGQRELAIVEEFHGDQLTIFKDYGNGYERALAYPLKLGHVLWGGKLAGEIRLISGSREGRRELTVRRFGTDIGGKIQLQEEFTADTGGGPSQISVRELGNHAEILTANYALGQLVKYTIYND